jgi:hypothetical protein
MGQQVADLYPPMLGAEVGLEEGSRPYHGRRSPQARANLAVGLDAPSHEASAVHDIGRHP